MTEVNAAIEQRIEELEGAVVSGASKIVRPLSTMPAGTNLTIALRDGSSVRATTSLVYTDNSSGVIAYNAKTRKAIPREAIKGWINE